MDFKRYRVVSVNDEVNFQNLVKTIKYINAALENPKEYLRTDNLSQYSETKICFKSKHLRKMLKKCIVRHKFIDAAKILECLFCEMDSNHLIFKAGFQILEHHPNTTQDILPHFAREIMGLKCVQKSEIILECVMYLIKHKKFQEAQQQIQFLATHKHRNSLRTDPLIEGLLSAYNGLLNYIKWAEQKANDMEVVDSNEESVMSRTAQETINIFVGLILNPGQWDIFVLKLIKILEHYKRINEIKDYLVKYAETNNDHLNAYIYLYEVSEKHSFPQEEQENYLQKIKELSPSDKRVLKYVTLLKDKDEHFQNCINILFDYLNFAPNKNDLKAWTMLAELLFLILNNSTNMTNDDLREIWNEYESYWPDYQFSVLELKITDENSAKLAVQKAIVLFILEDIKNARSYRKAVAKQLKHSQFFDLLLEFKEDIKKVKNLKKSQINSI